MENQVETKEKSLAFWLVVLAVLTIGVIGLFGLLKVTLPNSWEAQIWDEMTVEKTAEGSYQMRMLEQRERDEKILRSWLEQAEDEQAVYWLYMQEEDYYVLYLPGQDRALGLRDLTK